MQVLVIDSNQPTGLEGVVSAVASLVGPPHNYSATNTSPVDRQPAAITTPAADPEAAGEANAAQPEQLTSEQVILLQ